MKTITYEDYLTESKLGIVLEEIFGKENVESQFSFKYSEKSRYRIDYKVTTPNKTLYIEYNGDRHYTSSKQIIRDVRVRSTIEVYFKNSVLIEIPYFVQFNDVMFKYYFGIDIYAEYIENQIEFDIKFPQGFITDKCVIPGDYSVIGNQNFISELENLINDVPSVGYDIIDSLFRKIKKDVDSGFYYHNESYLHIFGYLENLFEMESICNKLDFPELEWPLECAKIRGWENILNSDPKYSIKLK